MQPFTKLSGFAAALPLLNVDTDKIIPKQFLKTVKRTGLGKNLFDEIRFTPDGQEIADFVLNREPYRQAKILITGANFGCGSSREHAPWALADFGITCIIAPSFADIFYNNCFKNGILPIVLPEEAIAPLMTAAQDPNRGEMEIDLENQIIRYQAEFPVNALTEFRFDIDLGRKSRLLQGLDDIAETLGSLQTIESFEQQRQSLQPWLSLTQ
ncbi:MAG: 3-isopropylmalate dehydratase small subunit [Alphaproteobacteria bacterium]|nr:3-isopropylmalate dehydratase small subunit [Alphaproteobacteria bacterium]